MPRDERRQALISYRTGDTLVPALPRAGGADVGHGGVQRGDQPSDRPPLTDAERGPAGAVLAGGGVAKRGE